MTEAWAWLRNWWYSHHCIICGQWERRGTGTHWACERELLP